MISVDWERLLNATLKSLKGGSLLRNLCTATGTLSAPKERSKILTAVLEAQPSNRLSLLENYLAELVAGIAKLDPARIDRQLPLTEMGFDSLMALEFRERTEQDLEVTIPVVALFRGDSVVEFSAFLRSELTKQHPGMGSAGSLTGRESAEELLGKLGEMDDQTVDSLLKGLLAPEPPTADAS